MLDKVTSLQIIKYFNNFIMGVVQSKKDGVVKVYQLKIDLKAPIKKDLLQLSNWSFSQIKRIYDSYSRKTDCPFIDFFTFHKILNFPTEVSRVIFNSYGEGDKYINIFEFICMLILTSHNIYRKKLQLIFVFFDFDRKEQLKNRQLLLIFQCFVNGYCRMTGQPRPRYQYLNRYTIQRFIRVNSLEAMEKVINYRRLIQQIQGNNDAFDLFKRFQQQIYGFFTQQSYLFRVNQYKKYDIDDIQRIYRIIKKVNSQGNYEQVQMVDKNRRFRLQNRKIKCIKQLLQQKQSKFKKTLPSLRYRSSSLASLGSNILPQLSTPIKQAKSIISSHQLINSVNLQTKKSSPEHGNRSNFSKSKSNSQRVLILNGKITNKEDIFQTIRYFKSLSANKNSIKLKEFFIGFQKKAFMMKQVSSLFKYFDKNSKGQVTFQDFLKVYYENISVKDIQTIKQWYYEYKNIHQADNFDISEFAKKKQKKTSMQLPKSTLKRMDELFNSIDRQKKGYLTLQDLKKAYNTGFSIKQLEEMMKQFGTNNKLYITGFIKMTLPEDWTIQGTDYVGI